MSSIRHRSRGSNYNPKWLLDRWLFVAIAIIAHSTLLVAMYTVSNAEIRIFVWIIDMPARMFYLPVLGLTLSVYGSGYKAEAVAQYICLWVLGNIQWGGLAFFLHWCLSIKKPMHSKCDDIPSCGICGFRWAVPTRACCPQCGASVFNPVEGRYFCEQCGYDLTGNISQRCPECGHVL